jgi:hypothetical protein
MKTHWMFAAVTAAALQVAMLTLYAAAGDAHAGTIATRTPPPDDDEKNGDKTGGQASNPHAGTVTAGARPSTDDDENGDRPGGQASSDYGSTHNQVAEMENTNPAFAASDSKAHADKKKNAKKSEKAVAPRDKAEIM